MENLYYIYKITNLINGKTYIGQHKYKENFYQDDYQSLITDGYWGSGKILKQAIKKHGKENFSKDVLVSHLEYKEAADEAEKYYISCYRELGKAEYNIAAGGEGVSGFTHSEEQKKKISESSKGRKHSKETRKKISEANKGKKLSEETRKKISESKKGKNHPNFGKHLSDETRKKMSVNSQGKNKGRHWYNNGEISVTAFDCPEGFKPGRVTIGK